MGSWTALDSLVQRVSMPTPLSDLGLERIYLQSQLYSQPCFTSSWGQGCGGAFPYIALYLPQLPKRTNQSALFHVHDTDTNLLIANLLIALLSHHCRSSEPFQSYQNLMQRMSRMRGMGILYLMVNKRYMHY